MELALTVVSEIDALTRISDEWEALLGRSECNEPALAPLWILPWWRIFGTAGGRSLRVGVFRNGGRLVGLAPLVSRWVFRRGVPLRRLEALPSGEDEREEIASEYIGLVCERGALGDVVEALASGLSRGAFGPFDELVMPAMNGALAEPFVLSRALEQRGLAVSLSTRGLCPYIPLPRTFDAYLGALPSSHRYRVTRSIRDFERWAGGDLVLSRARTEPELLRAREILEKLHETRWREDGTAGVFSAPRFSAFHDEVIPALFTRGALALSTLSARGEPVAALYNVVWNDKIYFYQSGRRVDLPGKLRPGIVAHALAIRAAIEEGLREYDFLGGARRYKTELSLATRPLVTVRAARRSLREALLGGLDRAAARLRARSRGEDPPERAAEGD